MSSWFKTYGFADVRDDLLVGAYPLDADDVGLLERMGVRHVLNLAQDEEYPPGQRPEVEGALAAAGIEETRLPLADHESLPPEALAIAVQTVVDWLQAGDRVYIHCRAGRERSAAVAAGAIAAVDGIEIDEALTQVSTRKPSAKPLAQQREGLIRWWRERA